MSYFGNTDSGTTSYGFDSNMYSLRFDRCWCWWFFERYRCTAPVLGWNPASISEAFLERDKC